MWFSLRSPELAEDFERLMTEDRDIVRGSLDTVSDWRLTRPADVPGQSIGQADYVLIAEVQASNRDSGGSGLGLAIVREVAAFHGGTVTIMDSELGGTEFEVRLPGHPD